MELKLIQTYMIKILLLWVEVGKSACVFVGICKFRISPPARYGRLRVGGLRGGLSIIFPVAFLARA